MGFALSPWTRLKEVSNADARTENDSRPYLAAGASKSFYKFHYMWYFCFMARHTLRNTLARQGVIFREIGIEKGEGFLIQVLDIDVQPPQVTTVVKQPDHEKVTIETVVVSNEYFPGNTLNNRFRGGTPVEPKSIDELVTSLHALEENQPLATVALQHLVGAKPL